MNQATLLAITGIFLTFQLGLAEPKNKWIPLPDDFVWPVASKDLPVLQPKLQVLADLPNREAEAIRSHWLDDKAPEKAIFAKVDLNGDQKEEIILRMPYTGTDDLPFYVILHSKDQINYHWIGSLHGKLTIARASDGWLQIVARHETRVRYLHQFADTRYQVTRAEKHNDGEAVAKIFDGKRLQADISLMQGHLRSSVSEEDFRSSEFTGDQRAPVDLMEKGKWIGACEIYG